MLENFTNKIMTINIIFLMIAVGFAGLLVFPGVVDEGVVEGAPTQYVGGSGPGNYSKIQDAIDDASAGDIIRVFAGTYYENVIVNKMVTLIGNGSVNTTIDGGGSGDVIRITANWVNMSGFTITNSGSLGFWPDFDAGIDIMSHHNSISNCVVSQSNYGIYVNGRGFQYFYNQNIFDNNSVHSNINNGIHIEWSTDNIISNNTCWNNTNGAGIKETLSKRNIFKNNYCYSDIYGIHSYSGENTHVNTNYCNNNSAAGIRFENHCESCLITSNICNNNNIGISLGTAGGGYTSYNCLILNNKCINNICEGLFLSSTWTLNTIKKNTCNSNNDGIHLNSSSNNTLANNTCISNIDNGIYVHKSSFNYIFNNTCDSNFGTGILIKDSADSNQIINNSCKSNSNRGLSLNKSKHNKIQFNNISYNSNGLYLNFNSDSNTFINNIISSNSIAGISIMSNCSNNILYYNRIISNPTQATDDGNNNWDINNEGNYWSDYAGVDDGTDGRVAGDRIGDTNLPHWGCDYYPFINPFDWLYPGIPTIRYSSKIVIDGKYTLLWNETRNTIGYILEEDVDSAFNSPSTVSQGSELFLNIENKSNGIYYYRIKAYNEKFHSKWSEIVNIIVDSPPNTPTGLVAKYPTGDKITLKWNPNSDHDLQGYYILINDTDANEFGPFHHIYTVSKSISQYVITNLVEETKYYFALVAFDNYLINSSRSNVVSATTLDITPPTAPTGLKISNPTNNSMTISWDANPDLDVVGYNLYRGLSISDLFTVTNSKLISETQYIDTDLDEVTTYYYKVTALDEVPWESEFSETAFGTTLLGPYAPEINNSISDFEIMEDCYDDTSINLYHWFKDINGDTLEFRCEGQNYLQVIIYQENGTVILKPLANWNGKETLTFFASDNVFDEVYDSVEINIIPQNDPPGPANILTPKSGHKVLDRTPIEFTGFCDDPDIQYGDKLTFKWSSNISDDLGEGKILKDIILPVGNHTITLLVTDSEGETSVASIFVHILETPESDTDGDGMPNIWEREHGLDPFNRSDADEDPDKDGLSNIEEYKKGKDPQKPDADSDSNKGIFEKSSVFIILGIILFIIIVVIIVILFSVIYRKRYMKQELLAKEAVTIKPSLTTVITIDEKSPPLKDTKFIRTPATPTIQSPYTKPATLTTDSPQLNTQPSIIKPDQSTLRPHLLGRSLLPPGSTKSDADHSFQTQMQERNKGQ